MKQGKNKRNNTQNLKEYIQQLAQTGIKELTDIVFPPACPVCGGVAVGTGRFCSFETGYHEICDTIQLEKYRYLFQCAKESNDFDSFMKFAV